MANQNRVQIIKYAPPPPELPIYGKVKTEDVSFIGRTNYAAALEEKKFIFGIKRVDRRRHLYIIGKSGVGKSKLLELLLRQDIASGSGLCLIDPDGDLIEKILDFIPKDRINDVCLIDPLDINNPVSFNPLSNIDPVFRFQFTQSLVEVVHKQFGSNWNPKIEHLFRFTCLALLDYPESNMQGVISMLTDAEYRNKVVEYITDDMVKKFFSVEFDAWAHKSESDTIMPLVNKLRQFIFDPFLKPIFEQIENKIDLLNLMNTNKIILVNLPRGRMGEESSSFFGSLFMTKVKQAGIDRANMQDLNQKDFYFYVDEFQHVLTNTFEGILSDARKYNINLTISHQYIAQISPKSLQAILGSFGNIIAFRIGGEDAVKLKPEFAPIFDIKDLINLAVGEIYIKMTIDGESYDPFSAETLKVLSPTHPSFKEEILESSRQKFSIPS